MLIIKLRSANTAETRQYKKATKALLVLIPLLGITYLVVLMVPQDDSVSGNFFTYLQAFLISTQVSRNEFGKLNECIHHEMAHRVSPFRCCTVSSIRKWNKHWIIDGKYGVRHGTLDPMQWNIESIIMASVRKSIRRNGHAPKVCGKWSKIHILWIFDSNFDFFLIY